MSSRRRPSPQGPKSTSASTSTLLRSLWRFTCSHWPHIASLLLSGAGYYYARSANEKSAFIEAETNRPDMVLAGVPIISDVEVLHSIKSPHTIIREAAINDSVKAASHGKDVAVFSHTKLAVRIVSTLRFVNRGSFPAMYYANICGDTLTSNSDLLDVLLDENRHEHIEVLPVQHKWGFVQTRVGDTLTWNFDANAYLTNNVIRVHYVLLYEGNNEDFLHYTYSWVDYKYATPHLETVYSRTRNQIGLVYRRQEIASSFSVVDHNTISGTLSCADSKTVRSLLKERMQQ